MRDQEFAQGTVVPIVHGPSQLLPRASQRVAKELYPILLAVPERALGDGIINRAKTVREIRNALDELYFYCPLHLLGTGNPISILVYAMAGADSFDGLEWCQTVVDHNTGFLHHFHHWDFLVDQTEWKKKRSLPYIQSALMHNLTFYSSFMQNLHDALLHGTVENLLKKYIPSLYLDTVLAIKGGES